MHIRKFVFLAIVLATLSACKKENDHNQDPAPDDDQKPTVTIQSPADGSTVTGGNSLVMQILFSDNVALSQYKVEIHSASDGHAHGKTQTSLPFAWDTIVNVSGTSANPTFTLNIPATVAAGPYHLTAQAIDAAGNSSDLVIRTLNFINPSDTVAPVLSNLTSPDTTGGEVQIHFMSASADTTINVACDLSDNIRLSGYRIKFVKETGTHKTTGDEHVVIYELTNTNLSATNYSLNIPLTIRNVDFLADPDHEEYAMIISAIDQVNNTTELEIPFHVMVFN